MTLPHMTICDCVTERTGKPHVTIPLERMDREIKRLTPSRPSEELCGDLRIAAVALREAGYPTGANACIAAAVRLEYIPTPPSEDKP